MNQQQQALSKLLGGAVDTGDSDSLQLPQIENAAANKYNSSTGNRWSAAQSAPGPAPAAGSPERPLTYGRWKTEGILKLGQAGRRSDTPVILLESKRQYYDIYVIEKQAVHLHEGQALAGVAVSDGQPIAGTIRFITQAPGFADLKETREKGQADLTLSNRIYTTPGCPAGPDYRGDGS